MKLTVFLVIALFGVAFCAPSDPAHSDAEAIEAIGSVIHDMTHPLRSKFRIKDHWKGYVMKAIEHINKECILENYKKHDSVAKIPTETYLNSVDDKAGQLSRLAFIGAMVPCYRKDNAILEYVFENLMTHHILVKAFIDEPAFKSYAEILNCLSKNSADLKIWNPSDYHFTLKEVHDQEKCQEIVDQGKAFIAQGAEQFYSNNVADYNKDCFKDLAVSLKNYVLKYFLLIQVDFAEGQKAQEREHFVKEFFVLTDKFVGCAAISAPAH